METIRSSAEWYTADDASVAGTVRRFAARLATGLGFSETRVGEVGIVASEVAANLHRHAEHGRLAVHVALRAGIPGIEVIAIDTGPGMADLAASAVDGHSTSGTLGLGLGAIERLSSVLDVSSEPGLGTVLVAGLWADPQPPAAPFDLGAITRPISGETTCGDAVSGRDGHGQQVLILADGLGHGPMAAAASQEALRAFHDIDAVRPDEVLGHIHRSISHTRGAAIGVATIDASYRHVSFAGIGNVSAYLVADGNRRSMVSYPGIVGHRAATLRQLEFDIDERTIVVLHSDGVRENWDLSRTPGLAWRSATVIAAAILRDAGSRPDDASVLIARRPS